MDIHTTEGEVFVNLFQNSSEMAVTINISSAKYSLYVIISLAVNCHFRLTDKLEETCGSYYPENEGLNFSSAKDILFLQTINDLYNENHNCLSNGEEF